MVHKSFPLVLAIGSDWSPLAFIFDMSCHIVSYLSHPEHVFLGLGWCGQDVVGWAGLWDGGLLLTFHHAVA